MANGNSFERRRARVRRSIKKVANGRPRLSVFRSSKQIYVQIIDDAKGVTLASASTIEKDVKVAYGGNKDAAAVVGKLIAERAIAAGIKEVVFDRGGYIYHGRVQAWQMQHVRAV